MSDRTPQQAFRQRLGIHGTGTPRARQISDQDVIERGLPYASGLDLDPGESVEVMPVSEHERAIADLREEVDLVSEQRDRIDVMYERLRDAAQSVVARCHADSGAALSAAAIQELRVALNETEEHDG